MTRMVWDDARITEALVELLRAHRVQVEVDEGWVVVSHNRRISASVVREIPGPGGLMTVQVDVHFVVWPGRVVVESFAGAGMGRDAAVSDAFAAFVRDSFHVLLAAFVCDGDDQVARERWSIAGSDRDVVIGNVAVRGKLPCASESLRSLFGHFERSVKAQSLSPGVHWVRVYHAQTDGHVAPTEVLLDNEPWVELQEAMDGASWPTATGYLSLRMFMVIQGGFDPCEAVATIANSPEADDEALVAAIVRKGSTIERARQLVVYIPLAFGRELLRSLNVTPADSGLVYEGGSKQPREVVLVDEPPFAQSLQWARSAASLRTMKREQFLSISLRSPEVRALNDALNHGAELQSVTFSQPVIVL